MDKVISALSSPLWWFTVVVVGIIVNLVSSYLKAHADQVFSAFSTWWRNKSLKRKEEYELKVAKLKSSKSERTILEFMCNRNMHFAIYFILFGIFLPVFYLVRGLENTSTQIVILGFSAVSFFLSYLALISSIRDRTLLFKILKEIDKSN